MHAVVIAARILLGIAVCGLLVAGVVVASGAHSRMLPAVSGAIRAAPVAQVAQVAQCPTAGPYRAPAADVVGVPPGVTLCPTGSLVIDVPGTVIDGWDIRGGILVDAANVVVRRSRITGDGSTPYAVLTTERGSVRIEYTTITGEYSGAALAGDRWTAERVDITGVTGDGVRMGRATRLRNSWLRDFAPPADRRVAGVTILVPDGDVLVEGNRIEVGRGDNRRSAVLLAPPPGAARTSDRPILIRGNVLNGGQYTVQQAPGVMEPLAEVADNWFGRDVEFAPMWVPDSVAVNGNRYLDGQAVTVR